MVLRAVDELRHPPEAGANWRESIYWNFNDSDNEIGAWIYLWVVPAEPARSGMIVSFYHGSWPDPMVYEKAMASPGHLLSTEDRWVYCYQTQCQNLVSMDFDDVNSSGLRIRRAEPFSRYDLCFDDGEGTSFSLDSRFLDQPFDYADGFHPTPLWLATNRYHRSHHIRGELNIRGKRYLIDCTGDSDHSWGTRDWSIFARHRFKMWSFQSADSRIAASVINQATDDGHLALGYVSIDQVMASARSIASTATYDERGVQRDIQVEVEDDRGRVVRATCPAMHSFIGWGSPGQFWGFEGVGTYNVEGFGQASGASSFFWPAAEDPARLHASGG